MEDFLINQGVIPYTVRLVQVRLGAKLKRALTPVEPLIGKTFGTSYLQFYLTFVAL